MCEDYHAEKGTNSLAVCSSFYTDARNSNIVRRKGFQRSSLMREINDEKIAVTKSMFRDKVVPEINSFGLKPILKPVSYNET